MLKRKKFFYQSMLVIASFAIITPLYASWYDSSRAAMLRLYQQVQSLFVQSPQQQPSETFAELARKSKMAHIKEKLDKIIPQEKINQLTKIKRKEEREEFKKHFNQTFPTQRSNQSERFNTELKTTLQAIEDNNAGTLEQWLEAKNLITNSADVNTVTQETGNSALHLALSDPNQELIRESGIVDFLTQYKANDRLPNKMGITPQDIKEQLERINQPTKPVARPIRLIKTPIFSPTANSEQLDNKLRLTLNALEQEKNQSAWSSYWESILNLINQGANINLQNNNGNTALHLAVAEGDIGKVFTLLGYTKSNNKINTEIKNDNDETAYDIARNLKNEAIIRILTSKQLPYSPFM